MASEHPRALNRDTVVLAATVVGIVTGGILALLDAGDAAHVAFAVTTVLGILPLAWSTIGSLRRRQTGVDLIALLAMAGALAFGEYEAGAVLALMLSSGQALEDYADRRAHKELSALLDRAPRLAHRYAGGDARVRRHRRGGPGRPAPREDGRGRTGGRDLVLGDLRAGRVGPHRGVAARPDAGAATRSAAAP